jgi:hypothetical protein
MVIMRKIITNYFVVVLAFAAMFAFAGDASAQRREARGRMVNKAQVKAVIDRVENQVDNFVRNYDRALDRSRLNNSVREDRLNGRAAELERATNELRAEFDRRDAWAENKDEVRRVLNIASDIDRNVRNRRLDRSAEANWSRVRVELNTLADVYNLPKVGAGAYR